MKKETYSLSELCSLVDMSMRTVRYYIQKGMVDRPDGSGRGASYSSRHVAQLTTIKHWKTAGLSLERIQELLLAAEKEPNVPAPNRRPGHVDTVSRIYLSEGVELHIDPISSGLKREDIAKLCDGIMEMMSADSKK